MGTQVHHREIGRARLCLLTVVFNVAAHPAEGVRLVGQVQRHHEFIEGLPIETGSGGRAILRIFLAGRGRICGQGRIVIGSIVPHQGAGFLILSERRFQILVGHFDLLFQGIEVGIPKHFPPVPAKVLVVGLCDFPVSHFLVGWRCGGGGNFVFGPDRASAQC